MCEEGGWGGGGHEISEKTLHEEFGQYLTIKLLIMVCKPYATSARLSVVSIVSICRYNTVKKIKLAEIVCALQSFTNLGSKCQPDCPLNCLCELAMQLQIKRFIQRELP